MASPSIFDPKETQSALKRLDKLTNETTPQWGKMNAAQMLAHLNVAYDITYGEMKVNNSRFKKFMLKLFLKNFVVGEKPYKKNGPTAPQFLIADQRDFDKEKAKLRNYIGETEKNGVAYFDGRENSSFGKMTAQEWSNLFYKHMDHHFTQFGI